MVKADRNLSPAFFCTSSVSSHDAITGGLLSRNPITSDHTRRRSRKVKEIAALYESQDTALHSKFQQRTRKGGRSLFADQVKREKLLQDYSSPKSTNHFHNATDSKHTNFDNEESNSDSDDLSIECMTLQNLKQRVLSKKRKIVQSVASPRSDLKNDNSVIKIKLEEVEPVLEVSLISLKSKFSKAPSTGKKRRKLDCRSSGIALDHPELTCASGRTESCGDTMKNMDYSPISSATELQNDGHNSKLISSVRTQKVETCSVDGCDSPYDLSPMPDVIKRNNSIRCFFSDPLQKASEVDFANRESRCFSDTVLNSGDHGVIEMDNNTSFSSVSEMKGTLHKDPESVSNFKQVGLVTNTLVCEDTVYNAVLQNAGELARVDQREHQSGESIDSMGSSLDGSVGKVTIDTVEPIKATCIVECGEEHFGEIREICMSELSSHQTSSLPTSPSSKISPSDIGISVPVSPVMGLDSDVCSKEFHNVSLERVHTFTTNTSYIPTIDHNHESMEINNAAGPNFGGIASSNLVHPEPGKHRANGDVIDHLVLYNEEIDLGDMFRSNMEVECLTDLIHKAPVDVGLNTDRGSHIIPCTGEHSRSKSYASDSTSHFSTCFSFSSDIQSMEGSPCMTDSDGLPDVVHCDSQIYPCSPGAATGSHSDNSSYNTAEELSSVDASISASVSTAVSDDTVEHYPVNEIRCDPGMKFHVSPRKILSNRQTFSPDSQEKLRRALTSDLDDGTKHPEGVATADLGPDSLIKKQKINRKASFPPVPKGILKSQDASCITPCSGNKSSPVQNQTEETIKFSLRQMHDIRTIAAKLLRGLKSMKNIVEETQCTETCPSVPSKFTADEIRMVTDEASELEATTNKWLSIMSKDCNRFCKILRTENKSTSPDSICNKRKKLIFADEAGGKLCHVKFFNQKPAAVSEIKESVQEP